LIDTQAPEAEPRGGGAVPDNDVGTEVERELGSQYGEEWYEVEAGDFSIGLASGPLSIQQATEKVREVLTRIVEPQDLAFAEAHVEVLSVPYTPDELKADAENILHELEAIGASRGASIGLTVGEFAGSFSPGYWPQVNVIFNGNATQGECEAAISVLAKYGDEISYGRTEGIPSSEPGATLVGRINPSSGSGEPPERPGVRSGAGMTSTTRGGKPTMTPTAAQKFARAIKACRKLKKSKRAHCVAAAKRRFAPPKRKHSKTKVQVRSLALRLDMLFLPPVGEL
jgi:hypothetical protein